ncbi:MAG: type IV pilus assembly protein PilC, partial [Lentimonas sp.]
MAILTSSAPKSTKKKITFAEGQRLAKQKIYEKKAPKKKIKLQQLTVFTQQLSAMLEAGITLVSALEAIQEQTQNPIFRIIIRNVK